MVAMSTAALLETIPMEMLVPCPSAGCRRPCGGGDATIVRVVVRGSCSTLFIAVGGGWWWCAALWKEGFDTPFTPSTCLFSGRSSAFSFLGGMVGDAWLTVTTCGAWEPLVAANWDWLTICGAWEPLAAANWDWYNCCCRCAICSLS